MATPKSFFKQNPGQQDYTPGAAKVSGDVVLLSDGRAGSVKTDLAASEKGSVYTRGIFDLVAGSAVVFSAGEPVFWDYSANTAINKKDAAETEDFFVGTAVAAKASGETVVRVDLNEKAGGRIAITTELLAASVDKWIFVADKAYRVMAVREVHSVIGGSGAVVRPRKVTAAGTAAPGDAAGATVKELTTADIGLETTINVAQEGTLSTTEADLILAAGDKIGLNFGGTLTGLVGQLTIELQPIAG